MNSFFEFHGEVPSSKSLWNRALVVKSLSPFPFQIVGQSASQDVDHLIKAMEGIPKGQVQFFCGDGGTTFRFLVLRLSRETGAFEVSGSRRLFSRPHEPLKDLLNQLGIQSDWESQRVVLRSKGWKKTEGLCVRGSESSQFATGLLLAGVNLRSDLSFSVEKDIADYKYFQMTLDFMSGLGFSVKKRDETIILPAQSLPQKMSYFVEPDMSCAFPLACLGALAGRCAFQNFPQNSLQPDFRFVSVLKQLGAKVALHDLTLFVEKVDRLRALDIDLLQTPDLFPVLACTLAFAQGTSRLSGLDRLNYKESQRGQKILDLLLSLGFLCEIKNNFFVLEGRPSQGDEFEVNEGQNKIIDFDCDEDHRLAMAASILKMKKAPVNIVNSHVVDKSFKGYFEILERSVR
jgi:3-phosphoshikimate 1-carboxyvinyltransferase